MKTQHRSGALSSKLAMPYLHLLIGNANVLPAVSTAAPPVALPAVYPPHTGASAATLYTVLRGSAVLRIAGRTTRLSANTALAVPAGTPIEVVPDPGAAVLPVPLAAVCPEGPGRERGGVGVGVARLAVPAHARIGLLHAFANSLGHLDGGGDSASPVPEQTAAASTSNSSERAPERSAPELSAPELSAPELSAPGQLTADLPTADLPIAPPAPRDLALQRFASLLTAEPGIELAAAAARTLPGWSLRTVQRRFFADTGWTAAAWARRHRICAAALLIADGRDLEWVAHEVGYRSLPALSRAFVAATGVTPGAWRHAAQARCLRPRDRAGVAQPGTNNAGTTRTGTARTDTARTSGARLGSACTGTAGNGTVHTAGAPSSAGDANDGCPADARLGAVAGGATHERRTWTRVNGSHVAVWAAIGSSELRVAGRTLELREGDAVVIPAGLPNELRVPPGSLLLPLGYRSVQTGPLGAPVRPAAVGGIAGFGGIEGFGDSGVLGDLGALGGFGAGEGSSDRGVYAKPGAAALLDAVLASYTRVGVRGVDPDAGVRAALSGATHELVSAGASLVGRVAGLCMREPELDLTAAAARLGCVEQAICAAVTTHTGLQFAAWRRLIRMTRARTQLGEGARPSTVSRALGYAHLPAFSRAFRAVHGAAPAALAAPTVAAPTGAAPLRGLR